MAQGVNGEADDGEFASTNNSSSRQAQQCASDVVHDAGRGTEVISVK